MKEIRVSNPKTFGPPGTLICDEPVERTSARKRVGQKCYMSWNKNLKSKKRGEEGVWKCAIMGFFCGLFWGFFALKEEQVNTVMFLPYCVWKLRKTNNWWYFLWRLPILAITVTIIKLENEKFQRHPFLHNWEINKAVPTRYEPGSLSSILKCRKTSLKEYSH